MVNKQQFDKFKLDIKKFIDCDFQEKIESLFGEKIYSIHKKGFFFQWNNARTSLKSVDAAQYNFDQVPNNAFDCIIEISSNIDFFFESGMNDSSMIHLVFPNLSTLNILVNDFLEIMKNSKIYCDSNH